MEDKYVMVQVHLNVFVSNCYLGHSDFPFLHIHTDSAQDKISGPATTVKVEVVINLFSHKEGLTQRDRFLTCSNQLML